MTLSKDRMNSVVENLLNNIYDEDDNRYIQDESLYGLFMDELLFIFEEGY